MVKLETFEYELYISYQHYLSVFNILSECEMVWCIEERLSALLKKNFIVLRR